MIHRTVKNLLRTAYLLPALGVLFSGNVAKDEGITALFNPEDASADAPYSQAYYQNYYESYYQNYYQNYYESSYWTGDGPDCPSPDACC